MSDIWWDANSNAVVLTGLKDLDGTFINDATVTVEALTDADDVAVDAFSPPESMSYITDSDGEYRYVFSAGLELTLDAQYKATVKAVGGGLTAEWDLEFIVRRRK